MAALIVKLKVSVCKQPAAFNEVFVNVPLVDRAFVDSCKVPVPVCEIVLKIVEPEFSVCVPEPVKVTVFVPGVNVPPVLDQLPETLKAPDGAVSIPELSIILLVAIVQVDPVNVPPDIVRPPLSVCIAVEAR